MGRDAALAVEDVARVALAALHAVVVAVTLQADSSTAGLADAHAALVVAVGRAGDSWNGRHKSKLAQSQEWQAVSQGHRSPLGEMEGVCAEEEGE